MGGGVDSWAFFSDLPGEVMARPLPQHTSQTKPSHPWLHEAIACRCPAVS
jgi:hypothetical protein